MLDKIWLLWILFAAIMMIMEIFTAGFFVFWFGVGALIAGILAAIGLGAGWQWGSFIIISTLLVMVSRKFAEKFTKPQPPGIGADRFVGMQGVVIEDVNNLTNSGRVRLNREEWRAESATGAIIPVGTKVRVSKVDGVHVIVDPIKEGE